MTIRCVIVDDEVLAREGLRILLHGSDVAPIEIVGEGDTVAAALSVVETQHPDVVFLDINMPDVDGFALLRSLPTGRLPLIVFVTAYAEHAVRGFDVNATDYLLKPVDQTRLDAALLRVKRRLSERQAARKTRAVSRLLSAATEPSVGRVKAVLQNAEDDGTDTMVVQDGARQVRVNVADVVCIQAAGDYMCISTRCDDFVHRATMKHLLQLLDETQFQRVHRSTAINIDHVRQVVSLGDGRHHYLMSNGVSVSSSKRFRDVARRWSDPT